ncbi:MAG: metallophosphoesterase family protein [Terrimicrobiaceae bacterium]|nr:metallophosphoesterase family protein [Terrimicrobiaceae bacterium]
MRIAVIADTHGKLPSSVIPVLKNADEIWHLGDYCDPATLDAVRRIGPPVEAILGNNDFGMDLPIHLILERSGRTFRLIHIPPRQPGGAEFLIHGHTHIPRDEMIDGTRVLNPGTIGKPNKGAPPSFAWLTLTDDGALTWEVVRI